MEFVEQKISEKHSQKSMIPLRQFTYFACVIVSTEHTNVKFAIRINLIVHFTLSITPFYVLRSLYSSVSGQLIDKVCTFVINDKSAFKIFLTG